MKTAIVYYSLEGNTEFVVKLISEKLNADIIRLEPLKEYPKGNVSKYVWGGKSVVFGEKPKLKPYNFDADKYDQLIIGTPIWASSYTPPIKTFLSQHKINEKKIALVTCSSGGDVKKCVDQLLHDTQTLGLTAQLNLIDPLNQNKEKVTAEIEKFCIKLM